MGRVNCEIEAALSSVSIDGREGTDVDYQSDGEWPLERSAVEGGDQKMTKPKKKKKKNQVLLEGFVEASGNEDDLVRTKSLTGDDLDELKGCLELGFGFEYEEIPELCSTLPALELCYSMSRKFNDESLKSPERESGTPESGAVPIASWRISSPGDHPEDVKARLKFWAQTVACTIRLCS